MKRHYVAAILLAAGLAAPALAAEKSRPVGNAQGVVAPGAGKESKKAAAKKKPVADKPVKVAQAEKPGSAAKSPTRTTRRMRGYGN